MNAPELHAVATAMVEKGRGILAADESSPTIKKRFDSISLESTEEHRRGYREMLFTTENLGRDISGVILFDETLRQSCTDGTPFARYLEAHGMLPGIKVDAGAKALAGFPGEKITEGLDGLRDRLAEYAGLGAKFAKWRAVIDIADGIPTADCIRANAQALARYAALCQEGGIVPIVEPEVLMDGAHDLARCEAVTGEVLSQVFRELHHHRVLLEGMVLKPNMVISGKKCPTQAGVDEVAEATVRCLKRYVPGAVPGVAFLSGGQSDTLATAHLNAMNAGYSLPWNLTFSYGRALQAPALKAWGGRSETVAAGQAALGLRARLNGLATRGEYSPDMEQAA